MKNLTRLASLAVLVAAGCGGGRLQAPADPGRAREALCSALDAWQRGDPPGSPAARVNDLDWSAGYRLARYQVAGYGDRDGIDLRYRVTLTLKDPKGNTVRKDTAYVVGTNPVPTVVRLDPDS
jgi:hypothetical protein